MGAESGHFSSRAYVDQSGVLHLNGTAIQYDEVNNLTVVLGSTADLAAAGSTQGTAAAIVTANAFVTGADGTKGVLLPTPTVVGQECTVVNTNGVSALKVYPDSGGTGGTVNGGAANAAASLAAGKGATYVCRSLSPSAWWSASN